jgi:hypothetical protein
MGLHITCSPFTHLLPPPSPLAPLFFSFHPLHLSPRQYPTHHPAIYRPEHATVHTALGQVAVRLADGAIAAPAAGAYALPGGVAAFIPHVEYDAHFWVGGGDEVWDEV